MGRHFVRRPAPLLWSLVALCLCPSGLGAGQDGEAAPQKEGRVVVEQKPEYMEVIYVAALGDCEVRWTVHTSELNKHVVQHRARCPFPLETQLPLMREVLQEIFQDAGHRNTIRTLFWGRLYPDRAEGAGQMACRLALAAHASEDWDAEKGKPRSGHENDFVVRIANEKRIFPELTALFAPFGRELEMSGAEKVLIQEAGRLPFFDTLREQGVAAGERLPYDCLAWFALRQSVEKRLVQQPVTEP